MQIGEVIRTYRKRKDMTQEEMARRLGVTAPAVNKWEKGNSLPDITLLAPIARLLDVSLDTLLAFREDLTAEEIKEIVYELDRKFKEAPYEEVFGWAKRKLEQYPDCEQLAWQIAVILDAQRMVQEISEEPCAKEYEEYIGDLYERVLESKDETMRGRAADSLFGFYMRKKQYEKAEECLEYFSVQNPERKRKQAQLYGETDRFREAYKAYEELLFASYQMISAALNGMYQLAVRTKDKKKAHMLVEKQEEMARCFEMGRYYEVVGRLDLAVLEKDTETALAVVEELIASVEDIGCFRRAPLYEHMKFEKLRREFHEEFKDKLLDSFRNEEMYGFLEDDERWQQIIGISDAF